MSFDLNRPLLYKVIGISPKSISFAKDDAGRVALPQQFTKDQTKTGNNFEPLDWTFRNRTPQTNKEKISQVTKKSWRVMRHPRDTYNASSKDPGWWITRIWKHGPRYNKTSTTLGVRKKVPTLARALVPGSTSCMLNMPPSFKDTMGFDDREKSIPGKQIALIFDPSKTTTPYASETDMNSNRGANYKQIAVPFECLRQCQTFQSSSRTPKKIHNEVMMQVKKSALCGILVLDASHLDPKIRKQSIQLAIDSREYLSQRHGIPAKKIPLLYEKDDKELAILNRGEIAKTFYSSREKRLEATDATLKDFCFNTVTSKEQIFTDLKSAYVKQTNSFYSSIFTGIDNLDNLLEKLFTNITLDANDSLRFTNTQTAHLMLHILKIAPPLFKKILEIKGVIITDIDEVIRFDRRAPNSFDLNEMPHIKTSKQYSPIVYLSSSITPQNGSSSAYGISTSRNPDHAWSGIRYTIKGGCAWKASRCFPADLHDFRVNASNQPRIQESNLVFPLDCDNSDLKKLVTTMDRTQNPESYWHNAKGKMDLVRVLLKDSKDGAFFFHFGVCKELLQQIQLDSSIQNPQQLEDLTIDVMKKWSSKRRELARKCKPADEVRTHAAHLVLKAWRIKKAHTAANPNLPPQPAQITPQVATLLARARAHLAKLQLDRNKPRNAKKREKLTHKIMTLHACIKFLEDNVAADRRILVNHTSQYSLYANSLFTSTTKGIVDKTLQLRAS